MIAFGCAVTDEETYERVAAPGFALAAEPDTELFTHRTGGTVFESYNALLDRAAAHGGLEAIVIVHQDAEIVDPDLVAKVREALADPDVALVGCAGAVDVRSIAWWEGAVTWASFTHQYEESGGGHLPALTWSPEDTPIFARTGEVDSIDGFVIGFSPWAIQNLRFDESISGRLHGYDFDICMQARAAGRKVVTRDLRVVHHHSLELISGVEGWVSAHIELAEKWNERIPPPTTDWRGRARRAEAELSATRLIAGVGELLWVQRARGLERELEGIETSTSWKLTAPLRWFARLLGLGTASAELPPLPGGTAAQAESSRISRSSLRENAGSPR